MAAGEARYSAAIFNSSTWTGDGTLMHAITNEWDDPTNATPVDDVEYAVK
jgi:hypothetical protein